MKKLLEKIGRRIKRMLFDDFKAFEKKINKETRNKSFNVQLLKGSSGIKRNIEDMSMEIVSRGKELNETVLNSFKGVFSEKNISVLIHLPPMDQSPGGHSLFRNMQNAFNHLGIRSSFLRSNDETEAVLKREKPDILLSSDNEEYLSKIDWHAVKDYKNTHDLKIGLTASLEEYGNSPLERRLEWANRNTIDFYYSFCAKEYVENRQEYKPFFESGYKIHSIEFGANPFFYKPICCLEKSTDYIFLASTNSEKQRRYIEYLTPIIQQYKGYINGPGWRHVKENAPPETHRYLYGKSKIGINLHIPVSINWPNELNERTYILAACGIPQLIDNPKLLYQRFSDEEIFSASSPLEYYETFQYMLSHYEIALEKAKNALERVYQEHTTFHRAYNFFTSLINNLL